MSVGAKLDPAETFSGRIFSYSARGRLPIDVTDRQDAGDNVESVFGYWHGPMACDNCEIVISAVLPLESQSEAIDVAIWWETVRENLFPQSLEMELCPRCKGPTLRYYQIDGWYNDGHPSCPCPRRPAA